MTLTEPVKLFFTALILAAIFKIKAKRSEVLECDNSNQGKSSSSKERFWKLKLSDVEKMRRSQAKKENLSRYVADLGIYLVFVFLLMVVCYGNKNDHRYLMTKSIRDGLPNFSDVSKVCSAVNLLKKEFTLQLCSGLTSLAAFSELDS